jgi:hypothetical protein
VDPVEDTIAARFLHDNSSEHEGNTVLSPAARFEVAFLGRRFLRVVAIASGPLITL